jgi:methionyl-tRNA synthetase
VAKPVVFEEKYCSHCQRMNWDSETGGYNEDCTAKGREGKKCDTNGRHLKYDEDNNLVN